jgi:hypothetical protein
LAYAEWFAIDEDEGAWSRSAPSVGKASVECLTSVVSNCALNESIWSQLGMEAYKADGRRVVVQRSMREQLVRL